MTRNQHINSQQVVQVLAKERSARALAPEGGYGPGKGRPRLCHLDEALDRRRGYLSRILRGEFPLNLDTLFSVLDLLEIPARDFFAKVFGAELLPAEVVLEDLQRQRRGPWPKFIREAQAAVEAGFSRASSSSDLASQLERLENLRFASSVEASARARTIVAIAIERQDPQALCEALGILGSIYRAPATFPITARCLSLALQIAEEAQLPSCKAKLYQRACYLFSNQGDNALAARVAGEAVDLYVLLDDRAGIGKALVDRGLMLHRQGLVTEAIQALESSLRYLPEDKRRNRFAAYQGLGFAYFSKKEPKRARALARQAEAMLDGIELLEWRDQALASLRWLEGEIALDQANLEHAGDCFRELGESLSRESDPILVALVSLRYSKVLFLAGKLQQADEMLVDMMQLLAPVQRNQVAGAVLTELFRARATHRLTADLLERAYEELRQKRGPEWVPNG